MSAVLTDIKESVAHIVLNRPEARNALNVQMATELADAFARARYDANVRTVLITGSAGAFCSGGDMRESGTRPPRSHEQRRSDMDIYARIVREALEMDKPIVAAVNGAAYGAGFSIALLADIILCSDDARFSAVFQRMGLAPDTGMLYTLPRVVGLQRAKELVFSAREVRAPEALALGIAMEVVPAAQLQARAWQVVQSLVGASPIAMSVSKRALNASLGSDLSTMLELEASGQAVVAGADYLKEAARRFVAKEPPLFNWPSSVSK